MDNQDSTNNPMCTVCNGFGIPLGTFGNVTHYRCRNCGIDFSQRVYSYRVHVSGDLHEDLKLACAKGRCAHE